LVKWSEKYLIIKKQKIVHPEFNEFLNIFSICLDNFLWSCNTTQFITNSWKSETLNLSLSNNGASV
jgi:hypothetical protein